MQVAHYLKHSAYPKDSLGVCVNSEAPSVCA